MPDLTKAFRLPLFAVCFAGFLGVGIPQAAQAQTLGTQSIFAPSAGGALTVVLTDANAWTATANNTFLHISQGSAAGTGSALISFTCDAFAGSNLLYLYTDTGALGPSITPGAGTSINNGQCTISGTNLAVSGSGDQLTLTVPITFSNTFTGQKNVYELAYDQAGLFAGWNLMGTWTP